MSSATYKKIYNNYEVVNTAILFTKDTLYKHISVLTF